MIELFSVSAIEWSLIDAFYYCKELRKVVIK